MTKRPPPRPWVSAWPRFTVSTATVSALLIAAAGCLQGCGTPAFCKGRERPVYALSIHDVTRRDLRVGLGARRLFNYDGSDSIWVASIPRLTSKQIVSATVPADLPDDAQPTVELILDRSGQMRWMQLCRERPTELVAVVVDGFFAFTMRVPHDPDSMGTVRIAGSWSPREALSVAEHAAQNYRLLND